MFLWVPQNGARQRFPVSAFFSLPLLEQNRITLLLRSKANIRGHTMKSAIVKRSIVVDGHKTSVSLEDAFWSSLKNIARAEGVPVSKMVTDARMGQPILRNSPLCT
jgi:Ribbon-helix-helix domain